MYNDNSLRTIADLVSFLHNPIVVDITFAGTFEERSDWINDHLKRFKYIALKKKDKGIVLSYLKKITHLTEKQLGRHIAAYRVGRKLC